MKYTNSSLISYKQISPSKTLRRNHKIDTITINFDENQKSVETLGAIFQKSSYLTSCNYAIGTDGRVALIVEEKNRSWYTTNKSNDNRAVTIECAFEAKANSVAYNTLIRLCADICQRNGIKELNWINDKNVRINHIKNSNLNTKKDFSKEDLIISENLYQKISYEVNKILNNSKIEENSLNITEKNISNNFLLIENAIYIDGEKIPNWIYNTRLYIRDFDEEGNVIFSTKKVGAITGTINKNQIKEIKIPRESKALKNDKSNYKVKINTDILNVRQGPGTSYDIVGIIKNNEKNYTIIETYNGFGKLSSGLGWINLNNTTKI